MSAEPLDTLEELATALRLLQVEVRSLRSEVSSIQETLSSEGRTLGAADAAASEISSDSGFVLTSLAAGYRVGAEREAAARSIGQWVLRCLGGEHRGLSGRERIQQSSRYYLVFRDFNQRTHNPPLLFTSWVQCKTAVLRAGQPGDSIYIGLPTQEEARLVIESAGLRVPPELLHGRSGRAQ